MSYAETFADATDIHFNEESTTGGFVPSSPKKQTRSNNTVFPITALEFSQMQQNNRREFVYDSIVVNTVSICGRVENVTKGDDLTKYTINDTTGSLEIGVYDSESEIEFVAHEIWGRTNTQSWEVPHMYREN